MEGHLYPATEPFDSGLLDVSDGNRIYWEVSGSPEGKPVVVLHGGPGSGSSPRVRGFFDPGVYRVISFDQRGCGKSEPSASDIDVDLSANTTWRLVDDIERLRVELDVDRWFVAGGSWGSTLALAYAEANPERVAGLILWGIGMTRPSEIEWLYHGVAPLFPEEWDRLIAPVPGVSNAIEVLDEYFRLVNDTDPDVRIEAARVFHEWDWALSAAVGGEAPGRGWLDPNFQVARARIATNYFRNHAWLEDRPILENANRLSGIPGVMVHGRLDVACPLSSAHELSRVWDDAELVIVPGAGHSTSDAGMDAALVAATQRLADTA